MRYFAFFLPGVLLLFFSPGARAQQSSLAPVAAAAENESAVHPPPDCDTRSDASLAAKQVAVHNSATPDPQLMSSASTSTVANAPIGDTPSVIDLERDLSVLSERESALAQCILAIDVHVPAQDSRGACAGGLLLNFEMRHDGEPERDIPIGRLAGTSAFFYESGMTIDADGAPNAYHPDNLGLDDLANAGAPGRWEGLAKDADGEPYVQGPDDPFPGYYVSATALADHSKAVNDPSRYVDASKIPFVVLPGGMAREIAARPGDFAIVFNRRNGKGSYAIFGDVGPHDRIGEGSVALAENLGIRSDARNGGARGGILYLVFPGSGNGRPRPLDEINSEGQKLLQIWESASARTGCAPAPSAHAQERKQTAN
jgi:Fungal chitosanase of glycosyl hydrolase group 75